MLKQSNIFFYLIERDENLHSLFCESEIIVEDIKRKKEASRSRNFIERAREHYSSNMISAETYRDYYMSVIGVIGVDYGE